MSAGALVVGPQTNLKQDELHPCVFCTKGMMHTPRTIHFYQMTVQQMVVDMEAVRRQSGLEMHMGQKAAGLAHILGPQQDMAKGMGSYTFLVCAQCADEFNISSALDAAGKREEDAKPVLIKP